MLKKLINVALLGGGKAVQNKQVRKAASVIAEEGLKKGTKILKDMRATNKKNERVVEEIINQLKDKIEEQEKEIEMKSQEILALKEELSALKKKKSPFQLRNLWSREK